MIAIKRQRRVALWLVPLMTVLVILALVLVHRSQGWQFVILLIGLILVDQCRPGRALNHLVVHLSTRKK
ncbi:hypothetical protein [Lactiplantibacillus plajomi]|uniref:Uncharacterized protein n=1 Tax=Lactiplantibacillus plajomi TaxID=1457217 RepID=A0ABV6K3I3_9LACO|nr:hypothetical protein [Lactiplantibacillus plajomi]